MAEQKKKSWLRKKVEGGLLRGLTGAYSSVQVDPERFLIQLRTAYRLPVTGYHGVFSLEVEELDRVADGIIRGLEKTIANKTVTYDFERLMTGAKLLKCSEFGKAIVDNM